MTDIKSCTQEFEKQVSHFRDELSRLRTGRANAALVENVPVEAYDTVTPLLQLASISIPDARTILISPWDASILKEIEKSIVLAQVGVQPANDGSAIRLSLPALTQENRKGLVKLLNERTEKARVAVRGIRDEAKESIISAHKKKELTDDDKFQQLKKLDEITRKYTDMLDAIRATKETEIMSI